MQTAQDIIQTLEKKVEALEIQQSVQTKTIENFSTNFREIQVLYEYRRKEIDDLQDYVLSLNDWCKRLDDKVKKVSESLGDVINYMFGISPDHNPKQEAILIEDEDK